MSLIELKVNEFINEVDSNAPAPGGGSVSALASTLGLGLSKMVAHLTIGKKKYLALDESIKKAYEENFNNLDEIKNEIIPLIDKDTEAFNKIMAAFKLPKETEEEKNKRNQAIEIATLEAIKVPYQIAILSYNALIVIEKMFETGNKNAITDIGVGALLLYSGLEGAILNVKINLSGLSDHSLVEKYQKDCQDLIDKGNELKETIIKKVHEAIS